MPRKASTAWVPFILGFHGGYLQKSTGIPASVIAGYRSGRYKMHEGSAKKLRNAYLSIQYKKLKGSGISRRQAKTFSRQPPSQVDSHMTKQMRVANEIYVKSEIVRKFEDYDTGLKVIINWMNHFTERTQNDWDIYCKQKEWIGSREYLKMSKKESSYKKKVAQNKLSRKQKRKRNRK